MTHGWQIIRKYTLGIETWYVLRNGTVVATFLSKAAAEAVIRRAMAVLS
jgi:hypothetical protein